MTTSNTIYRSTGEKVTMPTTALAGDRSRRARNPRDITGSRYTEQLAAKAARDAAQNVDLGEVRREARAEGFSAGWDAAIAWVIETYGLDDDEPGDGAQL